MLATVAVLSVLTMFGVLSPAVLLALTFLLNIGGAMNNPAWQAIVPELVPRSELADAIALNSTSFNLARAVGPALGGLGVGAFASPQVGAAVVFLLNSASFLAVIFVLYGWKRTPLYKSALLAERIFGSMRSGVRYVRHSPALRAILLRAFLFTGFAARSGHCWRWWRGRICTPAPWRMAYSTAAWARAPSSGYPCCRACGGGCPPSGCSPERARSSPSRWRLSPSPVASH